MWPALYRLVGWLELKGHREPVGTAGCQSWIGFPSGSCTHGVDAAMELYGQVPPDFVPAAYIALKKWAKIFKLDRMHVTTATLGETLFNTEEADHLRDRIYGEVGNRDLKQFRSNTRGTHCVNRHSNRNGSAWPVHIPWLRCLRIALEGWCRLRDSNTRPHHYE